jgi:hypothetical protein
MSMTSFPGSPAGRRRSLRWSYLVGAALLAGYAAFLIRHAAFAVGGSDSAGYANIARRLKTGKLVSRPRSLDRIGLPDEYAQNFIPLGFMNGPRPATMTPFYPPGFPAHETVAALIAGWDLGPYLVSPFAAVLSALLIYLLGRDLGLPAGWALAAAAIFAAWPVLLFQALQPMSDVVATFWTTAAVFSARRARQHRVWAVAAGAGFAIAVLVRPTDAVLLFALAFALPATVPAWALFAAGGVPFAGLLALYNLRCYGALFSTGYGRIELFKEFKLAQFPPRFRYYLLELFRTFSLLVPAAWLAFAADRRAAARDRGLLIAWFGSYLILFSFYRHYGSIVFDRFLLPGVPALALGSMLLVHRLATNRWLRLVASFLVCATILFEIRSVRRLDILEIIRDQSVYPETSRWASEVLPARSVVVAMQASGALEYYTDLAYIRWNWIDPASFARLRQEIERRGFSWFALVFPVDRDEVVQRMPGHWTILGEKHGVGLWRLDP